MAAQQVNAQLVLTRLKTSDKKGYTAVQKMIACLIKETGTGRKYSGKEVWNDGATCSFGKQAMVKLGLLPYGTCCRGGKCKKSKRPCLRCCWGYGSAGKRGN